MRTMYRLKVILRCGVSMIAAEAEDLKEAEMLMDELEVMMMDTTVAKLIFRDGDRMVLAKDVSAACIEVTPNEE